MQSREQIRGAGIELISLFISCEVFHCIVCEPVKFLQVIELWLRNLSLIFSLNCPQVTSSVCVIHQINHSSLLFFTFAYIQIFLKSLFLSVIFHSRKQWKEIWGKKRNSCFSRTPPQSPQNKQQGVVNKWRHALEVKDYVTTMYKTTYVSVSQPFLIRGTFPLL